MVRREYQIFIYYGEALMDAEVWKKIVFTVSTVLFCISFILTSFNVKNLDDQLQELEKRVLVLETKMDIYESRGVQQ